MSDFCHLHCHSEFSLLDGLAGVDDLVGRVAELKQPAIALTDHGVMHGIIPFARAAKGAGVKPIIGTEAYITQFGRPMGGRDSQLDRKSNHLLLLAENQKGYKNLLKISSTAQIQGYYYSPRIDADFLSQHAEGLITTTGCMAGEVPSLLNTESGPGNEKKALERFLWYRELFGKDRFYVELQEHSIPELQKINKTLIEWANKYDVPMLVTNDAHYARSEDADVHDTLLCVQTGSVKSAEKRLRYSDQGYYLKSRAELEDAFRPFVDLPDAAYTNSLKIAEMCNADVEDKTFHLPEIEIPEGHTYQSYLRVLTFEGLKVRYGSRADSTEVVERAEMELDIINTMGFDVYFIIVWDLCQAMKSRNIWWNVRGSGAGSIVAYATEITLIDPLEHHLIFQRFLNPGRISMPDFDLDIPDDSREEMIQYTIDKYGADQVAQISAFGRMKARAAVRDVGRALDVPLSEVDRIAKMIPAIPGKPVTIEKSLTEGNEFYSPELAELYRKDPGVQKLIDSAKKLEGVARHASTHAAAVIVTDKPLDEYVPLLRSQKAGVTKGVTQFEFPICESIGLLKVDFLGLATLSIMREAAKLIEARHGKRYTLQNIPTDDPESYRLMASGEVTGIFQVESAGMRRILADMQPHNFQHIMATVALYRPGPLAFIPNFIDRLHGREEITYRHPELEPILSETLGIIVYQEQIMRVATDLAGYNASEADFMRKAVAKKKEKDLLKHKSMMVEGAKKRGIPPETTLQIFGDIEAFARYGFPKAHAADYAVITVQTAYLKAHYPVEYMAALLLVGRDKTDKVISFINDCRRMGIDVLAPDINYSGLDFEIQEVVDNEESLAQRDPKLGYKFPVKEGSAIRFGMAAVKNVGVGPVQVILDARNKGGPFKDLEEFCDRVDLRQVNKRSLECLIKVGAFDRFGGRSQLLAAVEQMVGQSASVHSARANGQLSMFDLLSSSSSTTSVAPIQLKHVEEAKGRERLEWEKELLGVYTKSHPMQNLPLDMQKIVTCSCAELTEAYHDKSLVMAGMVSDIRTITTKKGDMMAFMHLEDLTGRCEAVIFPRTYAEYKDMLIQDNVILIKGKGQTRDGQTNLLADSIQTYVEERRGSSEDENNAQKMVPKTTPTINGTSDPSMSGKSMNGATVSPIKPSITPNEMPDINDTEYGVVDHEPPPSEASPFANDVPGWMGDGAAPIPAPNADKSLREGTPTYEVEPATTIAPNGNGKHGTEPETGLIAPIQAETPAMPTLQNGRHASLDDGAKNGNGHTDGQGQNEYLNGDREDASSGLETRQDDNTQSDTSRTEPQAEETAKQPAKHRPILSQDSRSLHIKFRRSGNLDRDKFRLKEIYDCVRNSRGRDQFFIILESGGTKHQLAFPNDLCLVNDNMILELQKHFRVDVSLEKLD